MRAQELFNQYRNKEINEEQFLYQVRRDPLLKEFISPVNSTEDVITILKQRVGITEQVTNEDQLIQEKEEEYEDEHGEALPGSDEFGEKIGEESGDKINQPDYKYYSCQIFSDGTLNVCGGWEYENDAKDDVKEHQDYMDVKMKVLSKRFLLSKKINPDDNKVWKDVTDEESSGKVKFVNEAKKPKLTADFVNYYEFRKGWRYEYENDPKLQKDQNIEKAKDIAIKNLSKDPIYYTTLLNKNVETDEKKEKKSLKNQLSRISKEKVELKDKINQMKPVTKGEQKKGNVKTNLGKQEKAKGNPKGVKIMKLKESIRKELKQILSEDANSQYVQIMRDMVKMKPEDLAKDVLADKLPMSGLRKEFAAKVLGKHIADGNKSKEVIDAFHKLSDKLNENVDVTKVKDFAEKVLDIQKGNVDHAINLIKSHLAINPADKGMQEFYDKVIDYLSTASGKNKVVPRLKSFSTNERVTVGDFDTWSNDVKDLLKGSLKVDGVTAHRIFSHYEKEFKPKYDAGKSPKEAVKEFSKGMKKVKEEFEGNTPPQAADFQDVKLGSEENESKKTVSKVHPIEGKMHKMLGLEPNETIDSKYKTGESLYNALARKVKDHSKLTGMLAYAANINKKKDVFDAALHYAKKVNANKKDE